MKSSTEKIKQQTTEFDKLLNREEVLQICYWYQGEGFGNEFDSSTIKTFLNSDIYAIEEAFVELQEQKYLKHIKGFATTTYKFSAKGKKEAGYLFNDNFSELQKAQHGECAAGCCDGDDHSQCGDECSLS